MTVWPSPYTGGEPHDPVATARDRGRLRLRFHVHKVALSRAFRAFDPAGRTEQRGGPDHPRPRLHGRRPDRWPDRRPPVRRRPATGTLPQGRSRPAPDPQPRARPSYWPHLWRPHPRNLRNRHPPSRRCPRSPASHKRRHPPHRSTAPLRLVYRPRPPARRPRRPLPLAPGWRRAPTPLRTRKTTGTEELLLGRVAL